MGTKDLADFNPWQSIWQYGLGKMRVYNVNYCFKTQTARICSKVVGPEPGMVKVENLQEVHLSEVLYKNFVDLIRKEIPSKGQYATRALYRVLLSYKGNAKEKSA